MAVLLLSLFLTCIKIYVTFELNFHYLSTLPVTGNIFFSYVTVIYDMQS